MCLTPPLAAMLALGLCGCGGSTAAPKAARAGSAAASVAASTADSGSEPNAAVVTVGGHAITRAMVDHVVSGLARSEGPGAVAPLPPDFAACVKHLEAASTPSENGPKPGAAALKNTCQSEYQKLEKQALKTLIADQWVIGGAAEAGVSASGEELARAVHAGEAGQSASQVEQILARTGRTRADFVFETKVALLGEGLRELVRHKTQRIPHAELVRYYDRNRSKFAAPKRRDLEIVRAGSRAEALKIKAEIAAGASFASVASRLPAEHQPVYSKHGFVRGYEPRLYQEPPLDHAIFAARPRVLSGPVGISLGYYVFRVTRAYPARQDTFAQAQAAIRTELPKLLYKRALVAFIKGWRRRWRARTDCQPGYVVQKCRQFTPSASTPAEKEDPYTLN